MVFNLNERNLFFIVFFALAALIAWVCLDIFRILRKEKRQSSLLRDFGANELFLRISEDFREQLKELIGREVQKNVEQFKREFQKASEEIINGYQSQFESGNQEIKRVLGEFSQLIAGEVSNLSKFSLEAQNKISLEAKTKILELNRAAEKEFVKIQEENLKTAAQIYKSVKENLNKKVQETEKEIEDYKKERFKEMDRKIYQTLGEVAKKTIGKTIDLSAHEKLVMEALEKAKKEIF